MLSGGGHRFGDEVASAFAWWAEAGLHTFVTDAPTDWLAPAAPPPSAPAAAVPAASALPDDLAAFQALLASGDYLTGAPPARRRIAPTGNAGGALMVVTDMPDDADLRAGRLLATETALFDAMLRAMGTDRERIYLTPLSPARLTGGRLGEAAAPLATLMRRHIALVRPRALLLFGNETSRALLALDRAAAGGALRGFNHDGGTVTAIATIHPRNLRRSPALKADAWAAMRLLLGELAQ